MKKFWIYLFVFIIVWVGLAGIVFAGAAKTSGWTGVGIVVGMLITIPAIRWWEQYFKNLFK